MRATVEVNLWINIYTTETTYLVSVDNMRRQVITLRPTETMQLSYHHMFADVISWPLYDPRVSILFGIL